jgi:hypothetical protein
MAKTFSNLKTDFLTLSKNSSSDNTTLAGTLLNIWIKKILSLRDWSFNTGVDTITTVGSQYEYELPYNCFRLKTAKQKNDDTFYILKEIKDRDTWNALRRTETTSDVPTHYFVNEANQLEIHPTPDGGGNTLYVYFRKNVKDYLEGDFETGTVTITHGSIYLVGSGTSWTSTMVGRHFSLGYDGFWREIGGYLNNAYLILKKPFYGASVAGSATYEIGELIPLPDGYEDLPLWGALADYYRHRGENIDLSREYDRRYKEALSELIRRDRRTESAVLTSEASINDGLVTYDPNDYPTITE